MTTIRDGFNDEAVLGDDLPLPPARLFERLAQVPGYTWDQTVHPTSRVCRFERVLTSRTVHPVPFELRSLVRTLRVDCAVRLLICASQACVRSTTQYRVRQCSISYPEPNNWYLSPLELESKFAETRCRPSGDAPSLEQYQRDRQRDLKCET
jgi:hypothetical protein